MEKIKNIEFLRFLFALSIVCFHLRFGVINVDTVPIYKKLIENFHWAFLPVDFFFIISGFFLFLTTNFNQNFIDFAKKKLIRFMPTIFFVVILFFIFSLFTPISFAKYENIFILLNIQNIGITLTNGNVGQAWFICSLFWAMSFYFYLYKCINKQIFNLITACLVIFCYSFWIHNNSLSGYSNVIIDNAFVINRGMVRALAGVGFGYFLSMVYKDYIEVIKAKVLNVWQKLLVTAAELYLSCFIFYYTCFHKTNYNNPLIIVIAFIGLFCLFVIKKGYFSQILENNFSVFLGQFAFAIFLTHGFIKSLWKIYVTDSHLSWVILHPYLNLVLFFITVILFSIFTYYFIEKLCAKYFKNKMRKVS